jgi:hypothetical protein
MAPGAFELIGLLLLGAGVWLWFDSVKAREAGVAASRAACRAEGLLFLDDTVAISSLWPARDDYGQLRLRRVYGFEYSDTGNNRRKGSVILLGDDVIALSLGRPRTLEHD